MQILNVATKRVAIRFYWIDVDDIAAVSSRITRALALLEEPNSGEPGTAEITAAGVEALRVAQIDVQLEEEAAP